MNIYLNFSGNAKEALDFYGQVFHSKGREITHYGDAPAEEGQEIPENVKNMIMHSVIEIDGMDVSLADHPKEMGDNIEIGNNISLVLNPDDVDDAKRIFTSLKDGGKVKLDLQETFWADAYGQLIDKFGVSWMINVQKQEQFGE